MKFKSPRSKRILLSLILTLVMVTILIYPMPALAVTISIAGLDGQQIVQGQTKVFYIEMKIETGEMVPISGVRVKAEGPTPFSYEFPITGGDELYIKLEPYQSIIDSKTYDFGYGYGYEYQYGYGYGYFPITPPYGYGYGYYPGEYGYGFYGPQTLRWKATLKNTAQLQTGQYRMTAEIQSNGVWWGGAPTEVTFTIVARAPVVVPRPDLTVTLIELPTRFEATRQCTIKACVKNTGTATAGAFNVTVEANDILLGRVSVSALAAGSTTTASFTWTPAVSGTYTLKATVDPENAITELDETNNIALATVTVEPFTLVPTDIDTLPPEQVAAVLENMTDIEAAQLLEQASLQNRSLVMLALTQAKASSVMLQMNSTVAAQTIQTMIEVDVTATAEIVEKMVDLDAETTVTILEKVDSSSLAELLISIARLPSTPQTVATILNRLSLEKSIEVVKIIIELEAFDELGQVLYYVATDRLNDIIEALTLEERALILPYITAETITRITPALLPFPDLTPTAIETTPTDPTAEEQVAVTVTVKNTGRGTAAEFKVKLAVNGQTVGTVTINELAADVTTTATFAWTPAVSGTYTLKATVDPENAITELDETNNIALATVTVKPKPLPDLTVQFVDLPTTFTAGTEYTITSQVNNIGEGDAARFKVELTVDGTSLGQRHVTSLAAGKTTTVTFTWTPTEAKQYTLKAIADSENTVAEANETNNEASATVTIAAPPIPTWLIALAIVVIIVIIIAVIYLLRKRKQQTR